MKVIIKARLILEKDGKVLLLAQTSENGGKFTLVGGTVESKEFARATLIRECFEEVGIQLDPNNLDLVHVLHKKKRKEDRITLYFSTKVWSGSIIAKETHKFKGVAWFSIYDLPARTSPTVRHVMKQFQMGERYSNLSK